MGIGQTIQWFKDRGYRLDASFDSSGRFRAFASHDGTDTSISLYARQGVDPDEVVQRLIRAVEALEGVVQEHDH